MYKYTHIGGKSDPMHQNASKYLDAHMPPEKLLGGGL